jgi:transposase InsO family protein
MTTTAQRQNIVSLIDNACKSGARMHIGCKQIGLACRTLQRWVRPHAKSISDALAPTLARALELAPAPTMTAPPACASQGAPETPLVGVRPASADHRQAGLRQAVTPHNKLTPQECEAVLAVINSEEFKDLPPSQIVPRLADQGRYLASESTMQRLLRSRHQNTHRRSERPAKKRHKPFALKATVVNQVYTWDITYLPTTIKGQYFYLYVFVDIFSRFIVGAQVFESESADLAAEMIKDICDRYGIDKGRVSLHSDNGSPMKGQTMQAMMLDLGVIASRSRPSVSNDNPYSESLFGTLKYRPLMPVKPFESIHLARQWAIGLVDWYNQEHRHSAIKFVTPQQRHLGQDVLLLQKRHEVYAHARDQNPQRWSKKTRDWSRVTEVHLNPDKPLSKELKSPEN